jgi:hypothetical protein
MSEAGKESTDHCKSRVADRASCTLAALLLIFATSCAPPTLSSETLKAIASDGQVILRQTPNNSEVPERRWSKAIRSLHPVSLRHQRNGLYIATSTFFVTEKGYFVPLHPDKFRESAGDPSYKRLARAVFWYEIKG